ncbi:MAG: lipase family protein [Acidimicrobiales bacterium]
MTTIDPVLGPLLLDASIQAYYAYDEHNPSRCRPDAVCPPDGYELVDCWTGVDTVFSWLAQVECFGVVFRSKATPHTYVFAFRGTYSILDALEDLASLGQAPFVPLRSQAGPDDIEVGSGFWSIYSTGTSPGPSMQQQVFALLDKYQASGEPIARLLIAGHSLGGALCQLFALDVALSPYANLAPVVYTYAGPRVGNPAFARVYDEHIGVTVRVQNTYDIVPCTPPESLGYQHAGDAYLMAFYNADAGWLDPYAKLYDHQALNYQAVLACALASPGGVCVDDALPVPTDAETLVSSEPDPTTVCSFWPSPAASGRHP